MTDQAGPDRTGPAILDIGPGVGALLLYAPPALQGRVIEVSPVNEAARRTHTEVLERVWSNLRAHTAVFAALPPGDYLVWGVDGTARSRVTITAGSVTELDWR
ncbi:MAG: phospholipase [Chloroflexi bacterium]|nr:MAG: phospholipase [Chloroflexota bacterium]